MKKIFWRNIILIILMGLILFFIPYISLSKVAADGTNSIVEFSAQSYDTLITYKKKEFIWKSLKSAYSEGSARKYSSRTMCIHPSAQDYPESEYEKGNVYQGIDFIDINSSGKTPIRILCSHDKGGIAKINAKLAYIAFYGEHVDENRNPYGLAKWWPSDTMVVFRHVYSKWLAEAASDTKCGSIPSFGSDEDTIAITTHFKPGANWNTDDSNTLNAHAEAYAKFVYDNRGAYNIKKNGGKNSDLEILEINGAYYLGPMKYKAPKPAEDDNQLYIRADKKKGDTFDYKRVIGANNSFSITGATGDTDNVYEIKATTTTTGTPPVTTTTYSAESKNLENFNNSGEFYVKLNENPTGEVKVKIKNAFNTYKARIFVFSPPSGGQDNVTLSGKQYRYSSDITYTYKGGVPNVTIDKKVNKVNNATPSNNKNATVQVGDTVEFLITIQNKGSATTVNLTDDFDSRLKYQSCTGGYTVEEHTRSIAINDMAIAAGTEESPSTISLYMTFKVTDKESGDSLSETDTIFGKELLNFVEITSEQDLNSNGDSSLSSEAKVTVQGYSYTISKSVNKTNVEPGESLIYTITLTNTSDSCLYNVEVEDKVPSYLQVDSYSLSTDWENKGSGNNMKFTLKSGKVMAKGTATFTLNCTVKNTSFYSTNQDNILNRAEVKKITNRNNINLDKKSYDAYINILGYKYNIDKSISKIITTKEGTLTNTTDCQYGDTIVYAITINNTGSGAIKTLKIKDELPTDYLGEIDLYGSNAGWKITGLTTNKFYLEYDGNIAGTKDNTVYVQAKVIKKLPKGDSDDKEVLTNKVEIEEAYNPYGAEVYYSGKIDSIDANLRGYKVSLYKYLSNGRKNKTDSEKYNDPVLVKKGDKITYTIEVVNEGTTKLYDLNVQDILPSGVQATDLSYSGNLTCTLEPAGKTGNSRKFNVEVNVTASNMYLPNIENTATITAVKNRNDESVFDVLNTITSKNKEYIRLDDLDISGNVRNDANKNGYKQSESGISGVDVILYDVTENKKYAQTTTDGNGNYSFKSVRKGKDFVQADGTTGYYSSNVYKQYYIEFKYNGVVYQSVHTEYESTEYINSDGTYVIGKYEIDSNASETKTGREDFNKSLETISYNKAKGNSGTKELTYNKIHNESSLDKSELQTTESVKISAYSFLDNSDNIQPLWLYNGNILQETDYLKHINLALYEREEKADLELTSTLDSQAKTINGLRHVAYRPEEYNDKGRIENHQAHLYWIDYYYDISNLYGSETKIIDYKNKNGSDPETNLEYNFKTKITNKSNEVDAVINEVAQYYNENFETAYISDGVPFKKDLKIDRDDDGVLDDTDFTYESKLGYRVVKYDTNGNDTLGNSITYDNSIVKLSNKYTDYIDGNPSLMDGFKVLYIELPNSVKLKPGETLEIYTTYMVGKDANDRLIVDNNYEVVSEINAYSTYFTGTSNPSGTIDIDSNPGNLGLKEGIGNVTPGVLISERDYYEDDTRRSNVELTLTPSGGSGRRIQGTVWDDGKMGDGANGVYESGESGIAGVKVQLYEVIKVGTEYFEIPAVKVESVDASGNPKYEYITATTSDGTDGKEKGSYELKGFFPGLYIVRFTYGYEKDADLKYNGHDYKSTIYSFDDTNNFEISNDNRQKIGPSPVQELPFKSSTTNTSDKAIYEAEKASETRFSDARDDEKRRLEVMEYSVEMYNKKAEILKGNDSPDKETFVTETKMFADTATFLAKNENLSRSKKADGSEDADIVICLGQIEEGTSFWYESSETELEDDKRFVLENGAAKHSATNGLWNTWSSKDPSIDTKNITTYLRNYVIENVDFGLVLRPENKIELKKYIKQITLQSSAGDTIVDLHYDVYDSSTGDLLVDGDNILQPILNEEISKGFENVQSLNNTNTHQGFRYLNVDEELLQGAKIGIKYGFIAINNSDIDYISSNLYGDEVAIQDLTTVEVINEISTKMGVIGLKQKHENNYYGYYLGNWYYTGYEDINNNGRLDIPEDLNDNGILDPGEDIDNDGVLYIDEDKDGDKRLDTNEDLNGNGVLDPGEDIDNDGRLDVDEDLNGNGVLDTDEDLNGNGILDPTTDVEATIKIDNILDYVDNSLVFSPTDNEGKWGTTLTSELVDNGYLKNDTYTFVEKDGNQIPLIVDIQGVEFQTDTKNNLAITIDHTSSPMFKHLLTADTSDIQRNKAETELMVSTFLSAENESDDMVYENIAEIIKFTTLTGRRTVSVGAAAQTVGNAKVHEVGYINDDNTLDEPDTSITEKVMLTPPTGADWIDTYVLTRVIIYVVGSIAVIVLGILFIPKLVTQIKNRKFIK